MGYKNSLEWQIRSVKSEAMAFLTHGSFLTGQRERYLTVYPFANMILNGRLSDNPFFRNFQKDKVFIFCNFRPKGDCRPDLLAFSSKGDVLLVEGKQRRKGNEEKALENLREGINELKNYWLLLQQFARESSQSPFDCWEAVYNNCYVKNEKHGFPKLDTFASTAISLRGGVNIRDLFRKINDNFSSGNILFGLAFNDPDDVEPFSPLDRFDLMAPATIIYKPNPKEGVNKLGYIGIENRKIYNLAEQQWDKKLGQLFLFGIDKHKDSFRFLDTIK